MSSAGLDNRPKRLGSFQEGRLEGGKRGQEILAERRECRQMDRGRDDVVRRLAEIDLIVWVNQALPPELSTEKLAGAIRDDFVRIRIGGGARASLEYVNRELIVETTVGDLSGRLCDYCRQFQVKQAQVTVNVCRRF